MKQETKFVAVRISGGPFHSLGREAPLDFAAALPFHPAMQKLRTLHLYLGCIFAPMIIFFALSGLWQTFGLGGHSKLLAMLSTIHTSHGLKAAHANLTSLPMMLFVAAMAAGLMLTTLLGVVMALKFGRSRKVATGCLAFGVAFPLVLVLIRLLE